MIDLTNVKRAFLDSSFIINVLAAMAGSTDDTAKFCLKLLEQLNSNSTTLGVSVISVTEICSFPNKPNFVQSLIQALMSDNVEILQYDLQEAQAARKYGNKYIGTNKLKSFISSFNENFPDHKILRDHISDDVKIVSTAIANNYDIILGTDHRTMYPISKEMGLEIICCHFLNCFNCSASHVFSFEPLDAEKEYNKRMNK